MKRLPSAESVIIEKRKIVDYLLSTTHPYGRTKATFFGRLGFSGKDWEALHSALREHALNHPVSDVTDTPFGIKYVIDGPLPTPNGKNPWVRTVWFVESGENRPRFVTAYPIGGGEK